MGSTVWHGRRPMAGRGATAPGEAWPSHIIVAGGCRPAYDPGHRRGAPPPSRLCAGGSACQPLPGRIDMADKPEQPTHRPERVPLAQVFFDNIFLLLVLGVAVPIVF